MIKQIQGGSMLSGSLTIEIPKGKYRALIFEIAGTNNSGQTLASTEVGTIRIVRNGTEIINVPFDCLQDFNNMDNGAAVFSSTGSGAFYGSGRHDFYLKNDLQNILKSEQSETFVVVTFSATVTTKVLSGTFSVYGETSGAGVEKYTKKLMQFNQVLGANGTSISPTLTETNIKRIFLKTASQISTLQIVKDDVLLVSGTAQALINDTAYTFELESAPTFLCQDLCPSNDIPEIVSSRIQLFLQSTGSATATIIYEKLAFDSQRTIKSLASYNNYSKKELEKDVNAQVVSQLIQSPASGATS